MEQLKGCEETCPLQAPGRWNNTHRHKKKRKKTFNNPLLALGSAPSPRFGRLLPKEAMPLFDPHLEPFTSLTSNNRSNHRRLWRAPALSQNFPFVPRLMRALKRNQPTSYLVTPHPHPFTAEHKTNKQNGKPTTTTKHLNRSGKQQDFFPSSSHPFPPHPL